MGLKVRQDGAWTNVTINSVKVRRNSAWEVPQKIYAYSASKGRWARVLPLSEDKTFTTGGDGQHYKSLYIEVDLQTYDPQQVAVSISADTDIAYVSDDGISLTSSFTDGESHTIKTELYVDASENCSVCAKVYVDNVLKYSKSYFSYVGWVENLSVTIEVTIDDGGDIAWGSSSSGYSLGECSSGGGIL